MMKTIHDTYRARLRLLADEAGGQTEQVLGKPAGWMDQPLDAFPPVSDDERALLVAWRNAKRATQQAVRLVLLPSREGLDNEISLALRLLELAAPAILNNNCQQPAPA